MKKAIEKTYGKALRTMMITVNPIKKKVIKTPCTVHKYINNQGIIILRNEGYNEIADFYSYFIDSINEGATWADQDFKSSNHFYHITKERGLYGFSNALEETKKYFNLSKDLYRKGDKDEAMFYLGAGAHIIQDMTVPHHVNNRLLDKHRGFELWIIGQVLTSDKFAVNEGIIKRNSVEGFIKENARKAKEICLKHTHVEDREKRYSKIAEEILTEAQRSTAGVFLYYYETIVKNKKG